MRLLLATTNLGKVREIAAELSNSGVPNIELTTLRDFPGMPDVVEDQPTFGGNAMKKARHFARLTGMLSLADDSGLCVDALHGAPGIYSARYAGVPCNDKANNLKLLEALRATPLEKRTACFVCALALASPDKPLLVLSDYVHGRIGYAPRGENGFGYDPLFVLPDRGITTAELTPEEKARVSHRGKAVRRLAEWLLQSGSLSGD
ncbi:MAG: RdgB/HAM1 family non-canonical purine NTP pyrophosphatase [Phycisphaerae bacterium]